MKKENLFFFGIISLFFLTLLSDSLAQEKYPSREIQLVLATAPGGVVDTSVRLMKDGLEKELGVPIVITNRPGAGGATGTHYLIKSKPDGYTIGSLASRDAVIVPASIPNLPYKYTDLDPLCKYASNPTVIICKGDAPWKTMADLVADAKKRPGKITYGATTSSVSYFLMEMFLRAAGIKMLHVPLKDAGVTTTRILGGNLDIGVSSPVAVLGHLKTGTIRGLAIVTAERDIAFPQIPTLKEMGYREPFIDLYNGFFAPRGLPGPIRETLVKALEKTLNDPALKKKLEEVSLILEYLPSKAFAKQIEDQYHQIVELTKASKPGK